MTDYIVQYYAHRERTPYKSIKCWLPNGERPKTFEIADMIAYANPKAKGFVQAVRNSPPLSDGRTVIRYANSGTIVGGTWVDKKGVRKIKWKTIVKPATDPIKAVWNKDKFEI